MFLQLLGCWFLLQSQNLLAAFEVKANVVNASSEIQDGSIYLTVSGGEAPYRYYWSLKHVPLDFAVAEGIDEGTQVTVIVTDALNRSERISTMVPAESVSERLNSVFIPLVDLLSAILLWDPFSAIGIYDPVVYTNNGEVLRHPNGDAVVQHCWLVVVLLIGAALWFTIYLGGINFRGFRHGFDLLSGKYASQADKGEVSQFQALSAALSGTLGLGNISLVAVAIAVGGPGATFWMIVAGLLGMSSKFVECTLGVKYRKISADGEVSGGPMYYLSQGLNRKGWPRLGRFLAGAFAVMCVGGTLGGGNMIQANQAFAQVKETLGDDVSAMGFGIAMAVAIGAVIAGGIKSIAGLTQRLIPAAVVVYVVFALIIIGMNITRVGEAFVSIFNGAFQPDAMKGGFIGVMMMGFRRASFSNEAGIGSASIAHSASKTNKPVSEGFVALLEPFIDTVVVCTMTALVLVFTGYADNPDGLTGSALTNAAFTSVFPWFDWILMIAIIVFAYATMISWSYYGMKSWSYLLGEKWYIKQSFNLLFVICTVIGTVSSLGAVVDFSDMMILGMAFPNLIGLFMLQSEVKADMKTYWDELRGR